MLSSKILDLSRQAAMGGLSPWFDRQLAVQIEQGLFLTDEKLQKVQETLVQTLSDYRQQAGLGNVVLGMSGGVDSALTAALFKAAGWRVIGFTLPIQQDPAETERGVEACAALGIEHQHLDLSPEYEVMVKALGRLDRGLQTSDSGGTRTRRGNLRARLRMMTLYDQAHRFGGLVASTDNFSELGAGFWTLHGDVGDLAPLQSLIKSWEVPWLACAIGVPERTWRANPTDGLGIGAGDEAQIGATYLEWDIMVFAMLEALEKEPSATPDQLGELLDVGGDDHARQKLDTITQRLGATWHKRMNPIRLRHPLADRYALLNTADEILFRPPVMRSEEATLDFPADLHAKATDFCRRLQARKMHVVTAESCTGGLLASSLADAFQSSTVLEGSFVTYSAAQKTAALGVSRKLIDDRTVYDPEVARQMAAGALAGAPEADLALAITGVAGPGPDQGKPAGYVCIASCLRGQQPVAHEFNFPGNPDRVLAATMSAAIQIGLSALEQDK